MTLNELCVAIENTGFATAIRESAFLFPAIESLHVIALTFVVGTIWIVDLRLLGLASTHRPVTRVTSEILPWTWGAFAAAAITGLLLFSSIATRYYDNGPFRYKVLLLALAGLNMLAFHSMAYKSVAQWDDAPSPPAAAKLAGGLSIVFWTAIVAFGRWIGFT